MDQDARLPGTGSALRVLATRYAVTWAYVLGFVVAEVVFAALPGRDQAAVLGWSSTSVANLRHDPAGSLVASAFIGAGIGWPVLLALAVGAANHLLGNWRTLLVCAAAQMVGTLVSEGIVAYRIAAGQLPAASAHILDVGPSYIAVSALTVAALYGARVTRGIGIVGLALLIVAGDIFGGLTTLQVAAVGHTVSIVCAVLLGGVLAGPVSPGLWRVGRWRGG